MQIFKRRDELWRSRGAEFITEPKPKYGETRCYIRDPDGYIIEVGQATRASLTAKGPHHKRKITPEPAVQWVLQRSLRPKIGDTWTRNGRVRREIIRVEPIDSNFEKWGAPVSTCTRAGNMVFVSGMPPFDPETGEILVHAPFERQVELILEQVKKALEAAGSDLDHVLKCNVLCISADRFKAFNEVYKRYFPKNPPARIFFCVPEWTGPFDVEVDCVAVTKD